MNEQVYFLGVDGGGTKTQAVLVSEKGEILGYGRGGPSNLLENGEDVVRASLRSAISRLLKSIKTDEVVSCFGLPAVGEAEELEETLSNLIHSELGIRADLIVNDVVVGWAAGTLCENGIHVVAGTGLIVYGRFEGRETRVSGWGSIIGDEGSAYYIGLETIREVTKQLDGRKSPTVLKELFFRRLGFKNQSDLIKWVYGEGDRRSKIASVAPMAHEAATLGDPSATKILENAAREIFISVKTAVEKLGMCQPLISYSGSVLEKNEFVFSIFQQLLRKEYANAEIRRAPLPPCLGAVLLARRRVSTSNHKVFVERLLSSQRSTM